MTFLVHSCLISESHTTSLDFLSYSFKSRDTRGRTLPIPKVLSPLDPLNADVRRVFVAKKELFPLGVLVL